MQLGQAIFISFGLAKLAMWDSRSPKSKVRDRGSETQIYTNYHLESLDNFHCSDPPLSSLRTPPLIAQEGGKEDMEKHRLHG